jgi:hypothetical protein
MDLFDHPPLGADEKKVQSLILLWAPAAVAHPSVRDQRGVGLPKTVNSITPHGRSLGQPVIVNLT